MKDREDKYTIEWEPIAPGQERGFRWGTIVINELWSIGHLTFKEPLQIEVSVGVLEERALAMYDFGMDQYVPLLKEKNSLYNYAGPNNELDPLKTVFSTIKFDLMHAFFHYVGDPNYGHLHWALRGNLKDRVVADDGFIFEDHEQTK